MSRVYLEPFADAAAFIARSAWVLKWGELTNATVMDIGCGYGVSSRALINNFPEIKRVIAFDKSPQCLHTAIGRTKDEKVEYVKADIEKRSTLDSAWTGEIEHLVSVYCMNCMENMRVGYENLCMLLKPGGEAAILQSISSPYSEFLEELKVTPNWVEVAKNLSCQVTKVEGEPIPYFRAMFLEIGFEVIECYTQEETFTFNRESEFKAAVFRTLGSLVDLLYMDREVRAGLMEDAYRIFLKYNPRDDQGNYTWKHCSMVALLRKPENPFMSSDILT